MTVPQSMPKVSVIIVNYNGLAHLEACLTSVFAQAYPNFQVIVVDNGSTDGSAEFVEHHFPEVKVVRTGVNLGFGCASNLGAQADIAFPTRGEYLAFLNPDTVVEPNWLEPLVQALEHNVSESPTASEAPMDEIGLATAKILLHSQPDRINTCGNEVHFVGFPACRGWMLPSHKLMSTEDVFSVSGAAFVIRRVVFDKIGGFDGRFFLYLEDNDLSWRARLAGYRSICVPDSLVYHKYEPNFDQDKFFYLERNRYVMLCKNLYWRTLWLLLPALILAEVIAWGYAMLQGKAHMRAKLRAYQSLWTLREEVMERRRTVQAYRQVSDRDILRHCTYRPSYNLAYAGRIAELAGAVFNPLFFACHRFVLAFTKG